VTTAAELKQTLIASWPPGTDGLIDWEDSPGKHIGAMAETFQSHAVAVVEELQQNSTPLTATSAHLRVWERALGLSTTRTARTGTIDRRRAQVVSRLREYGATTIAMIQSVIAPLLDYADPTDLVILEPDFDDLRAKHTYGTGLDTGVFSVGNPRTLNFYVRDDAFVSPSGAQVDLILDHPNLAQVRLTLYAPDGSGAEIPAGSLGRGAASMMSLRAYFRSLRGVGPIWGYWSLRVESLDGAGEVHDAELFVEGFGRDRVKNDGLGSAAFSFAAVYEPLKSRGNPDFDAARAAIARISYASRPGALVFIADASVGLSAGDYGSVPSDNATPGACVPGAP